MALWHEGFSWHPCYLVLVWLFEVWNCTINEPEIGEETIGIKPMDKVIGQLKRMLSLPCSQKNSCWIQEIIFDK